MIDSPAQLIAILVVALLLFGPRKLPELARGLGQSVREFKRSVEGIQEEIREENKEVPQAEKPKAVPEVKSLAPDQSAGPQGASLEASPGKGGQGRP